MAQSPLPRSINYRDPCVCAGFSRLFRYVDAGRFDFLKVFELRKLGGIDVFNIKKIVLAILIRRNLQVNFVSAVKI